MDLKKGMDDLEEKIKRYTGTGIDWGYHYDLLSEMYRSMVGGTPDNSGWMHSDEEWLPIFQSYIGMTKDEFIAEKEAQVKKGQDERNG